MWWVKFDPFANKYCEGENAVVQLTDFGDPLSVAYLAVRLLGPLLEWLRINPAYSDFWEKSFSSSFLSSQFQRTECTFLKNVVPLNPLLVSLGYNDASL